jgi:tetratricopeptide (TPR) repeat protein
MKVCVYGICLNEAAFVERFMASTAGVDMVVIADTGSTDDTVARFEAAGAVVHSIRIIPWRFDAARNAALDLVPADVDVCVSLDLDQVLCDGWRAALEAGWAEGVSAALYTEIWGRTPDGTPQTLLNNRIHARHGWRWVSPCHEYLEPTGAPGPIVTLPGLVIEQQQDEAKTRDYLALMQLAVAERPDDPHPLHYLAREFLRLDRPADAIAPFERYLATAGVERSLERSLSLRMLSDCQGRLGRRDLAAALCRQAVTEAPACRGAWIDLAFAHYEAEAWGPAFEAAAHAAELPRVVGQYGEDAHSGALPEDIASLCAWRLGRAQEALAWARRAAALAPGVERIARNLAKLEAVVTRA